MRNVVISLGLVVCARALGANVYIMSSGDAATDNAAAAALTSNGNTATIGVRYSSFNGTISLAGFDAVYLQDNANWAQVAPMPQAGQQQLTGWINAGGRLVTSEWVTYYAYSTGPFAFLAPMLPATSTSLFSSYSNATYTQTTVDPAINAGLPASFTFPLYSYAGTEVFLVAKGGATTYYTTGNRVGAAGLIGWPVGAGSVFSFTSTCGPTQMQNANFARLFSNVANAGGVQCGSADFDHDGDIGTDSDIEAFFACLGGSCCESCETVDFDRDGDIGTDADIESFFRVLSGGPC